MISYFKKRNKKDKVLGALWDGSKDFFLLSFMYFLKYETNAQAFFTLIILAIGRVQRFTNFSSIYDSFPIENNDVNYENPLT